MSLFVLQTFLTFDAVIPPARNLKDDVILAAFMENLYKIIIYQRGGINGTFFIIIKCFWD